ncbi:MAG TPA: hypothetical protein VJR23_16680 [Candidatus Acidoferrales bacterium]|nr:hypothetical protein [Candidatus Acidoferrales bacterium]
MEVVVSKLTGNLLHDARRDWANPFTSSGDQRMFAQEVDHARDALRIVQNRSQSLFREHGLAIPIRRPQPQLDVRPELRFTERSGRAADRNPLMQLPQFRALELLIQIRLTDEYDLQEPFSRRFPIQQKSKSLKDRRREALCLVND